MRVPLASAANEQIVTIRLSNVNCSSGSDDADFGFLIADANASRTVDRPDLIAVRSHRGQPVTAANFRDDITRDGVVGGLDRRMTKLKQRKAGVGSTKMLGAVTFVPSHGRARSENWNRHLPWVGRKVTKLLLSLVASSQENLKMY